MDKDLLQPWLQQILHSSGHSNMLEWHLFSANLKKFFVNHFIVSHPSLSLSHTHTHYAGKLLGTPEVS